MSAILGHVEKDPDANKDYTVDWSVWLNADTISASTWVVSSGITAGTKSNTTTTATVWLSGGTGGASYVVTNRITTSAGRTEDASFIVRVAEQ